MLYQAPFAMTEIDFVPGPFSCRIEQQHLDFGAVVPSLLDYQTIFSSSLSFQNIARFGRGKVSVLRILISGGGTPLYHCGTGGCLSTNFSTGPVTRHGRVLTGSNVRCSHRFPQGHASYGQQRSVFASVSTRIRNFRFCVEYKTLHSAQNSAKYKINFIGKGAGQHQFLS